MIFFNNQLIVQYIKCQKIVKQNHNHYSLKPKLTYSGDIFLSDQHQKPKGVEFTIMETWGTVKVPNESFGESLLLDSLQPPLKPMTTTTVPLI